jgi:hypothetical protein
MKKFAPLAMLLGILSALFFASAGTASANPPAWSCINSSKIGVGVVQVCTVDVDVTKVITVESLVNLTSTNLSVLENDLNNNDVLNGSKIDVIDDVLNVYNNDINVPILSGNVIVIGFPCPCSH